MITPATVSKLREVLSAIEQGNCSQALRVPLVREVLRDALDRYEKNHSEYERLSSPLDGLARAIAQGRDGGLVDVPMQFVPLFQSRLYELRRYLATRK